MRRSDGPSQPNVEPVHQRQQPAEGPPSENSQAGPSNDGKDPASLFENEIFLEMDLSLDFLHAIDNMWLDEVMRLMPLALAVESLKVIGELWRVTCSAIGNNVDLASQDYFGRYHRDDLKRVSQLPQEALESAARIADSSGQSIQVITTLLLPQYTQAFRSTMPSRISSYPSQAACPDIGSAFVETAQWGTEETVSYFLREHAEALNAPYCPMRSVHVGPLQEPLPTCLQQGWAVILLTATDGSQNPESVVAKAEALSKLPNLEQSLSLVHRERYSSTPPDCNDAAQAFFEERFSSQKLHPLDKALLFPDLLEVISRNHQMLHQGRETDLEVIRALQIACLEPSIPMRSIQILLEGWTHHPADLRNTVNQVKEGSRTDKEIVQSLLSKHLLKRKRIGGD